MNYSKQLPVRNLRSGLATNGRDRHSKWVTTAGRLLLLAAAAAIISPPSLLNPLLYCSLPASGIVLQVGAERVAVNSPLLYTRLRHDDKYLQLYRNYQLERPYEEKSSVVRFNEPAESEDTTRTVEMTFYENPQVDASNITEDDLILEALDRTYRSRILPAYMYRYDRPEDKRRASDPRLVSAARCSMQIRYLIDELNLFQFGRASGKDVAMSPELAAFFDSYAGHETGLLFGNYHWTGNWRQCYKRQIFDMLNRKSPVNATIAFTGRYCIASLRSPNWKEKIAAKVNELTREPAYFRYPEQRYDYARSMRIQVGLCLPESCDSLSIEQHADQIRQLTVHKLHEPVRSYELVDLFCLPDDGSELRRLPLGAWLFILAAFAWSSMVAAATTLDWAQARGYKLAKELLAMREAGGCPLGRFVSAVSLLRNYNRLVETKSSRPAAAAVANACCDGSGGGGAAVKHQQQRSEIAAKRRLVPDDLLFLNFFKVISMPIILFGHIGMMAEHLDRFPLDFEAFGSPLLFHLNASSIFLVDWYFMLTGLITTYIMFVTNKVGRNSAAQWLYTVFHRYWRLAPLYVIVFWYTRSVSPHLGSGPVWDYATSNTTVRATCQRESWLWPLTLTSNLHPVYEECIMPSWYISSDMQFYLLAPFLLVALYKSPLVGWLTTLTLIGASLSLRFYRYATDPHVRHLELINPRMDMYVYSSWDVHATYLFPQYRISSYLVGILAGHYVYMVLSGKWTSIIYPHPRQGELQLKHRLLKSRLRLLAWFGGLSIIGPMLVASWLSTLFPRQLLPYAKYFAVLSFSTTHTLIATGLALFVVAFALGQFGWLKRLLAHPIWTLISRLNYLVLLIQVEIMCWIVLSSERLPDFSAVEAIKSWILVCVVSYSLAVVFTLWLELPLAHLEREFIGNLMFPPAQKAGGSGGGSDDACEQKQRFCLHQNCEMVHQSVDRNNNNNSSSNNNNRLGEASPLVGGLKAPAFAGPQVRSTERPPPTRTTLKRNEQAVEVRIDD